MDTKDKSDESNTKDKSIERDFSKFSFTIKCYKCQDYGHVTANYPSSFKIVINNEVFIETPKPHSTISPKDTYVIREFSVFPSAATVIIYFATTTVTRHFLPWLYCLHHLLYYRSLLSLPVLVTDPFLLYYRRYPFSFVANVKY